MTENGRRILLVEDDPAVRRATARILRPALGPDGMVVDEAPSVAAAKRLLDAHRYVAGLFDVCLPDGDGLGLLAWARAGGWDGAALVVTGETDPSLPGRAFLLRAQVVCKPASVAVLRAFAAAPRRAGSLEEIVQAVAAEHELSERQTTLLSCYAHGTPRSNLARAMSVEENTVKTMVRQVLNKTGESSLDSLLRQLLWRATGGAADPGRAAE